MKFVDDYNKELKWYNRNWLFLGTLLMVAIILVAEFVFKDDITKFASKNFFVTYSLIPVMTGNAQKAVVSAVFMLLAGLYLERYWGTLKYIFVSVLVCPIVAYLAVSLLTVYALQNPNKELTFNGLETSMWAYAMFGFVIIVTLFHLRKYLFDKKHSVFNWLLLAVIILTMCTVFPVELVEDKYVEYIKGVKFTTFENLTKNYINLIGIGVGGLLALVCEIFSFGLSAVGGGYSEGEPKSKGKKGGSNNSGLTFADIMEKEKEEQQAVAAAPLQPETSAFATQEPLNNSAANYVQQSQNNFGSGQASGFNTNPQPAAPAQTTEEPNRIKVGETLKQYSDYNEYINEKMKNLNAKTKKD